MRCTQARGRPRQRRQQLVGTARYEGTAAKVAWWVRRPEIFCTLQPCCSPKPAGGGIGPAAGSFFYGGSATFKRAVYRNIASCGRGPLSCSSIVSLPLPAERNFESAENARRHGGRRPRQNSGGSFLFVDFTKSQCSQCQNAATASDAKLYGQIGLNVHTSPSCPRVRGVGHSESV